MKIILEGPQGRRLVEGGVPYKLLSGEKIIDIDRAAGIEDERKKLEVMAKEQGVGVGDLIAKLTKTFGIKPCSSCEQRRKVLNKLRINNWKITKEK